MLIDTHVHLFPDKLCPKTIEKLAKTDPNHHLTYYGDGSLGCAEKNMKEWGVDLGVMLPIATNPHQQKSVNDFAAYVQNHSDAFISFGTVHPDAPDYVQELDRIVEMGFHGIKLHPDYQGFFINEKRLYPMYQAISDRKLPVVFHTGYDPISPGCIHATPEAVVEMARQFPELTIIAAHTGGLYFGNPPQDIYLDTPNVTFDTAIASYTFAPEAYRRLIDIYGAERFIFATDNPWGDAAKDLAFFEAVGLTRDEREMICHENAERLIGI